MSTLPPPTRSQQFLQPILKRGWKDRTACRKNAAAGRKVISFMDNVEERRLKPRLGQERKGDTPWPNVWRMFE
jgi:hypothetical protein